MNYPGKFLTILVFGAAGCVVVACDATGSPPASAPGSTAPVINNAPIKVVTPAPITLPLATLPVAPVVTTRPTPPPTSAPGSWVLTWSSSDTAWAINALQTDYHDDLQAALRYPDHAAFYNTFASHWAAALDQIAWMTFSTPQAPTASEISLQESWYQQAYNDHALDEQANPQNKGWDDQWLTIYSRLLSLWGQL